MGLPNQTSKIGLIYAPDTFMHTSGLDLINRGNALQSSWNLCLNQWTADLGVCAGWNKPMFNFGGNMLYGDTFSSPNIGLYLENSAWQANQYYGNNYGNNYSCTPGMPNWGMFNTYSPTSNGSSSTDDPDITRYNNLKSKVQNLINSSSQLLTLEEKSALRNALSEADRKETGAEKYEALQEVIEENNLGEDLKEYLAENAENDIKKYVGLYKDQTIADKVTTLHSLLHPTNTGNSNSESDTINYEQVETNLIDQDIIVIISEYNTIKGNFIDDIENSTTSVKNKVKTLLKAAAMEMLDKAEVVLDTDSYRAFEDLAENGNDLDKLYREIRIVRAMIQDYYFADQYGSSVSGTFIRAVGNDLCEEYNVNRIEHQYRTKTGNTTRTTGTEDVEDTENITDISRNNYSPSSYTNEEIKEFLKLSSLFGEPTEVSINGENYTQVIRYKKGTNRDESNIDKYYYIINGELIEGDENGPNPNGKDMAEDIHDEIKNMYNYDLENPENIALPVALHNATAQGTVRHPWGNSETKYSIRIGTTLKGDTHKDNYSSTGVGGSADQLTTSIIENIGEVFKNYGYNAKVVEKAVENTKNLYNKFLDKARYIHTKKNNQRQETFTIVEEYTDGEDRTQNRAVTYRYGAASGDRYCQKGIKLVECSDLNNFKNENGEISTGIVRADNSKGFNTLINHHVILMHFMDQLQKAAKAERII